MNRPRQKQQSPKSAKGKSQSPLRLMTIITSVGLLGSFGAVSIGAMPATTAIVQDEEHQKDHDVDVELRQLGADGNVEVVVVQDDDADHDEMLEKLGKQHKIQRQKIHAGQEGNVEVVVVQEGDSDHEGILKKLKKEHNIRLHNLSSGSDGNVEVFVVQDSDSDDGKVLKKIRKEHKHPLHKIHSQKDGNVKVVVVQDDDANHRGKLSKLKTGNHLMLHKLLSDSDGHSGVFVVKGDEDNAIVDIEIKGELGKLFKIQESKNTDHRELARKLREIADQLDGKNSSEYSKQKLHHEIELHHGADHDIRIEKRIGDKKLNKRIIELKTDSANLVQSGDLGGKRQMIIELKSDEDGKKSLHKSHHEALTLQAKKLKGANNIIVKKLHGDDAHNHGGKELHFRNKKSSDNDRKSSIDKLRSEIEQLREEINQLQSLRPDSSKKRARPKKSRSASADDESDKLVWVVDDAEKAGNKFVWKTGNESDDKDGTNRFHFEFRNKDQESTDDDH